jgi:hypothetical protein
VQEDPATDEVMGLRAGFCVRLQGLVVSQAQKVSRRPHAAAEWIGALTQGFVCRGGLHPVLISRSPCREKAKIRRTGWGSWFPKWHEQAPSAGSGLALERLVGCGGIIDGN